MEIKPLNAPISFFNEQRQRGNVKLSPKYQRRLVWPVSHKVYLIDTILKGLPIPKFFVQLIVDPKTGKTIYNVVDGQQRLNAIFEFIDGKFSLSRRHHPFPEQLEEEIEDCTFQDLPKEYQEKFWSYLLTVEQLINATENEIRDMFVRLNKNNVRLNPQELRNALYEGDFKKLVYELADEWAEDFFLKNKILSLASIRRMGDAEFVSELLVAVLYGIQDKKKKLDKYYADNEEMDEREVRFLRRTFNKIINLIINIFGDDLKTTRFKNKSDFYSLFYVLFELLKEGYKFDENIFEEIKKVLIDVHKEAKLESNNPIMVKYYEVTVNSPDAESSRKFRHKVLRELIEPLLIKTDKRRFFTETQKQFIWHMSKDKRCAICGKIVKRYEDYEPDHIIPWSKGGLTTIENAQITHRNCNKRKSNKI